MILCSNTSSHNVACFTMIMFLSRVRCRTVLYRTATAKIRYVASSVHVCHLTVIFLNTHLSAVHNATQSFAEWIHRQRTTYASVSTEQPNPMIEERMQKLTDIGFVFTVQ
jgi:hypothetical protein